MDIMPSAGRVLSNSNGIKVLCDKILNIEYIDIAEACIRALEKVSVEHGMLILEAGGMETMLNFLDFFMASTQVRETLKIVEGKYIIFYLYI